LTSIVQIGAIAKRKPIPDLSDEKIAKETLEAALGKGKEDDKPKEGHNTATYEK
jgi:hypothetical protein